VVDTRLPPFDLAAEEAVNGSLLIDGKAIYDLATFLKPQDFYSEPGRLVYEAALTLFSAVIPLTKSPSPRNWSGNSGWNVSAARLISLIYLVWCRPPWTPSITPISSATFQFRASLSSPAPRSPTWVIPPILTPPPPSPRRRVCCSRSGATGLSGFHPHQEHPGQVPGTAPLKDQLESVPTGFYGLNDYIGGMKRGDLIIVPAALPWVRPASAQHRPELGGRPPRLRCVVQP